MGAPTTIDAALSLHRRGELAGAARAYREVLAEHPRDARAAFLLGGILLQGGRPREATEWLRRAIEADPGCAAYHANLGECYRRLARPAEAMDAFVRALTLAPGLPEPLFNLGLLMQEHGEVDLAIGCFECAAELKPDALPIREHLDRVRRQRLKDALPGASGHAPGARALSAPLLAGVAATLGARGRHDAAIALCRRALEVDPRCARAHHNLGCELLEVGRQDEAIAAFRRALEIDAGLGAAHCNLGNALFQCGLVDEALDAYRRVAAGEHNPGNHSNILFTLPFRYGSGAGDVLAEAREWNRRYAVPRAGRRATSALSDSRDRAPERRIRVGYVSGHFRVHCQSFFTVPLFEHHDHAGFEVFAYSDVASPDPLTARLKGCVDQWRSVVGLRDEEVAATVRQDGVDILVDLTMHMEGNRLLAFAEKPAPLQVCWLAYPGTTGLDAMDYRITDPHLDPPGADLAVYAEKSIRLPDSFWCYDPLTGGGPEAGPLPARANGRVTFGCLNNFAKVNRAVLDVWARVLVAVPGARLVLMAPPGDSRRRALDALVAGGATAEQVEFVDRRPRPAYLASYAAIDVCLDTFPSNGHTTSLDALWMGVPVVTLAGDTPIARAGLCHAANLGLEELVAFTADAYVAIAGKLAQDLVHLEELRRGLRARLQRSPLMDGPRFARAMEEAYRRVWRAWCAQPPRAPG